MLQALGTIWFRFQQEKYLKKFHACVCTFKGSRQPESRGVSGMCQSVPICLGPRRSMFFSLSILFVVFDYIYFRFRPSKVIESDEWFSPFRSANHWLSDERLSGERKGKLKKLTHERQRSRGKNWVGSGKRTSKKWASAQLWQWVHHAHLQAATQQQRQVI